MRFLSAGGQPLNVRGALWSLPDRNGGAAVSLPDRASFLYLDPRATSPNVLLGVRTREGAFYMAPGDVRPLPAGTTQVLIFNPLAKFLNPAYTAPLVGFVGLAAGLPAELPAIIASRRDGEGVALGNLLWCGTAAQGADIYVPTLNLTGLRVSLLGVQNVTGAIVGLSAGFVATVTPQTTRPELVPGDTYTAGTAASVPALGEDLPGYAVAGTVDVEQAANFYAGASAYLAKGSHDFQIACGAVLVALNIAWTAGAGMAANRLYVAVEGR